MKDYEAELQTWGFAAHPLVDGDKVISLVGGANAPGVVALDKKTGKEVWKALSVGEAGYNPPTIFEVNGRRVLVIWHAAAVVGLDPETGKKLWQHDWRIKAALTVPNVRLVNKTQLFLTFFYNGSLLLDVGGDTPRVVWKSKSKGVDSSVDPRNTVDLHSIMPAPWVKDDHVYGICSYGELRCLELLTGKRVWETHAATAGQSARWANAFLIPHAESGNVFLFNEKGDLIIARLTPKGYEEIDRAKVLEPTNRYAAGRTVVWSHPAFANRNVYARNDKEVVAVSLQK